MKRKIVNILSYLKEGVGYYQGFFRLFGVLLLLLALVRVGLVINAQERLDVWLFIYGLRMDTMVLSALFVLPVVFYSLGALRLVRFLIAFEVVVLVVAEIANFWFFDEFRMRLNYMVFDYLRYPEAVFAMLWDSYRLTLLLGPVVSVGIGYAIYRWTAHLFQESLLKLRLAVLPLLLIVLFIGIRSSFHESTPNPSFYSYSTSPSKNEIANSSLFSLVYALKYNRNLKPCVQPFLSEDPLQAIRKRHPQHYTDDRSLKHHLTPLGEPKQHLMLLILESFGNSFVGVMGGKPETPFFDAMTRDGFFVSQMYSSSNRSNRGIEAILSSIYPIAAESYLKLPKSTDGFWTLARPFNERGYRTIFLYGGDSKFDNMRSFVLAGGFDEVIDLFDFPSSLPRYGWGISDEDLLKYAEELIRDAKEPTMIVAYTVSSHRPFIYPQGRTKPDPDAPMESFDNAIHYTDWAVGKFYERLKKSGYFKDSVLALVADHNAYISGKRDLPVDEFRIPFLVIGPGITPRHVKGVAHQADVAPTLLSIMGIEADIPAFGVDLMREESSRAIITHRGLYASVRDDSMVIYSCDQPPRIMDHTYQILPYDEAKVREGLEYIYGAFEAYDQRLHR